MGAAFVGLLGVVVGALLGGIISVRVEDNKRRLAACVAGQTIADELETSITRMENARTATTEGWWSGALPTEVQRAHLWELRSYGVEPSGAAPDIVQVVIAAYTIIDQWNARHAAGGKLEKRLLNDDIPALRKVVRDLGDHVDGLGRARTATTRHIIVYGAAVVVGLLTALAFIPQPDVTATTVADTLQNHLGADSLVHCRGFDGEWTCVDNHLSEPRSACLTAALDTISVGTISGRAFAVAAASMPHARCTEIYPPTVDQVIASGDTLVVTPQEQERAGALATINEYKSRRDSWFDRVVKAWWNGR